eukprot:evm.model.NODE_28322_length_2733_cov_13.158068.1
MSVAFAAHTGMEGTRAMKPAETVITYPRNDQMDESSRMVGRPEERKMMRLRLVQLIKSKEKE